PMVFLFAMTTWAMVAQLGQYVGSQWLLFGMGAAILALEVWLILEAVAVIRRVLAGRAPDVPGFEKVAAGGEGSAGAVADSIPPDDDTTL
ncbi:MAG TPA: hypothetical protein VK966_02575, partial [Longimicrobiales bacterium]|nr:hypothetical protein [Longimicrobiales bacterium]